MTVSYEGFIDLNWLNWQQLSWILAGVLEFVEGRAGGARALEAWVSMRDGGGSGTPFGMLEVGYEGGRRVEERRLR